MKQFALRLWRDDAGFVVSTELVLIATIVVIGLIAGLTTVRDAVVTELADVADAISEVDQSYSYGAVSAHCAITAGTTFNDQNDFCEVPSATNDQNPQGGAQCVGLCIDGNLIPGATEN
jgi:Flp pilus assembly pilin Flp